MKRLFLSKIFHKRFKPTENSFTYNGFYIHVPIDNIESIKSRFFSVNKFNFFSFYNRDYGARDGGSLRNWSVGCLETAGINTVPDNIILQTTPRVLGFVFNPVNFWFCYSKSKLIATIAEVNNTFGENHSYVVNHENENDSSSINKFFHVSPFLDVNGYYDFQFNIKNKVKIDYYLEQDLYLITSVLGKEVDWSVKNFSYLIFKYPLYSTRILFLIHWQALKLYLKKVKFYSKPEKPVTKVTYEN